MNPDYDSNIFLVLYEQCNSYQFYLRILASVIVIVLIRMIGCNKKQLLTVHC